jgi:hypothetical protein
MQSITLQNPEIRSSIHYKIMSNAVLMNGQYSGFFTMIYTNGFEAHTGSLSSHFTAAHSASAMPYRESTTTLTNDDFCKNVTFKFSKSTWVNRLLGIAGAKHSKERQTIENQTSMPPTPEVHQVPTVLDFTSNEHLL